MKQLQIVVVGPGLIGKQHIRLIQDNPQSNLAAIVAPKTLENVAIATEHDVPIFTTLEDCLSWSAPDAVIVASPNEFHASHAKLCIETGIPTLIEKPITSTIEDGHQLVELVEKHSARVLVGHHRVHSPILQIATAAITAGRIGDVVSVMGSAQFYKPHNYFVEGPWRTKREAGGGPILINLIHEIRNLRMLGGEIEAVQAMGSSKTRGFEVEDTVAINFMFKSGALGVFLLSDTAASVKSWELTSGENPAYPNYPDEDCYVISGKQGSLAIPSMHLKYFPKGTEASWLKAFNEENLELQRTDPLANQLEHFIAVIKGVSLPLVSALDGYKNLLVADAINDSCTSGQLVKTGY